MNIHKAHQKRLLRRRVRIRARVKGSAKRPRLAVFRSSLHIYAQLINDVAHTTLSAVSDRTKKMTSNTKKTKVMRAHEIGLALAKKAKEQGITAVVFDRGGRAYHGRIKALAEGAREGGLIF